MQVLAGGVGDCRHRQRRMVVEHFVAAMEDVARRYRALAADDRRDVLYAEAATAEVAHHLAVARASLRRYPAMNPNVEGKSR